MAAWLAWLKSRLLLPKGEDGAEEGEMAAEQLASRLRDLARVRQLAEWLGQQPQLGQETFARGAPEDFTETDRSRFAMDVGSLMRALLSATRRASTPTTYNPRPIPIWSVQQALERLTRMIGSAPGWTNLLRFLPETIMTPLERRGAYASSLLAGLELARDGQVELQQDAMFAPIMINPTKRAELGA
jgi:segregation and condensation protein A